MEPRLPPEIEHEIFVFAFRSNTTGRDRCTLLLVAKRVSEWLIPLLYNAIAIEWISVVGKMKSPPTTSLQTYGHHVHNLFLMSFIGTFPVSNSKILSLCPNVSNLALWFGVPFTPEVLNLPIKRFIMAGLIPLKIMMDKDLHEVRFTHWRSNITHIGLGQVLFEEDSRYFAHFPALRYLMVLSAHGFKGDRTRLFGHCPQLKVLILVSPKVSDNGKTQVVKEDDEGMGHDVRVVTLDVFVLDDWKRGTEGLPDMWEIAEREVEIRRKGLI